jgi:hypothetical protein
VRILEKGGLVRWAKKLFVVSICALSAFQFAASGPAVAARSTKKSKTTKAVKKSTKPVSTTPVPVTKNGSGVWRACTVRARLSRFTSYNPRKVSWYVYTQAYIHVEQKAQCSGAGPIPQMRAFQPARIGGAVYVDGALQFTDDRGQQFNASYSKYASEANVSSTNPNLMLNSVGFGLDDYSEGVFANLSFDSLLRGSSKFWGLRKETSSTPDGGFEDKLVPFSTDEASILFLGGGPTLDKGGKGVDGLDFGLSFRPSPGTPSEPQARAAADNVRNLLATSENGLALAGDYYGASNTVQANGYVDVRMNRQHFVVNNADLLHAVETHFVAWIETDNNTTPPNDLPPLDRDPNAPLERPITKTPPPAA